MGIVKTWKNEMVWLVLIAMVAIGTLYPTHVDKYNNIVRVDNQTLLKEGKIVSKNNSSIPKCDFFLGKWVYDNISYPLYKEGECSLMGDQFTSCAKYGRKDFNYQNWRWQPHHCDIPRFNGIAFLEKIRGKKLVFVGDSLGRNQWESMLCLIESYLPPSPKPRKLQIKSKGNLNKFHFIEYDVTIGFYWAPLLVESNCDDPEHHRAISTRIIKPESIHKHGRHWIDADILVFDSFAWWTAPTMKILWGSFESPDAIYKEVETNLRRYEIALNSWSEWLEIHINRTKTNMFFMSHSPFHFGDSLRKKYFCYNQTEPIFDSTYWPSSVMRSLMQIAESIIEKLDKKGVKVEYLNVTQLSGYRKDAHPSIFRNFTFNPSLEELIINSDRYSDCMHWCLPGVPDVWNQILYYYIMNS